jgi:hypothetical protein
LLKKAAFRLLPGIFDRAAALQLIKKSGVKAPQGLQVQP